MKLCVAVLLSVVALSGCGPSTSSDGKLGYAPTPGPGLPTKPKDVLAFEALEHAFERKIVPVDWFCPDDGSDCYAEAYPKTKTQLADLSSAIEALEKVLNFSPLSPDVGPVIEESKVKYRKVLPRLQMQQKHLVELIAQIESQISAERDKTITNPVHQ